MFRAEEEGLCGLCAESFHASANLLGADQTSDSQFTGDRCTPLASQRSSLAWRHSAK